ncbi:hypothetical protein E4U17_004547 [Claviceps sp. LM77 group G4]|nr:hypothetical protein E4U17_004547 [Claviceps sp. LM77 group G4]KAG6084092.1 hypothetical protein E4U33_003981 [Claviceps sp. LM78 group G4]
MLNVDPFAGFARKRSRVPHPVEFSSALRVNVSSQFITNAMLLLVGSAGSGCDGGAALSTEQRSWERTKLQGSDKPVVKAASSNHLERRKGA